jgi:predicted DNA-binding transcriptional regulator AlpA
MSHFLTMPEASAHCGGVPSPETLYRLAREGHLPVRRIGRRLVISDRLLDQWIDSTGDVRDAEYPDARPRLKSVTIRSVLDSELEVENPIVSLKPASQGASNTG